MKTTSTMKALLKKVQTIVDRVGKQPCMGYYIQRSSGMVILSATEHALALSGQHGTGVLIQHFKTTKTWSNPSAIRMSDVGVGFHFGSATKDMVIFLNRYQVKALANNAVLRLGSQTGYAVASGGIEGDEYLVISDLLHVNTSAAYTDTQGWKFGFGLHGGVLSPMWKVNRDFYGDLWKNNVTPPSVPAKILAGKTMKELSEDDKQHIEDLHESLNWAIEHRWIPDCLDDEASLEMTDMRQTVEVA